MSFDEAKIKAILLTKLEEEDTVVYKIKENDYNFCTKVFAIFNNLNITETFKFK